MPALSHSFGVFVFLDVARCTVFSAKLRVVELVLASPLVLNLMPASYVPKTLRNFPSCSIRESHGKHVVELNDEFGFVRPGVVSEHLRALGKNLVVIVFQNVHGLCNEFIQRHLARIVVIPHQFCFHPGRC